MKYCFFLYFLLDERILIIKFSLIHATKVKIVIFSLYFHFIPQRRAVVGGGGGGEKSLQQRQR